MAFAHEALDQASERLLFQSQSITTVIGSDLMKNWHDSKHINPIATAPDREFDSLLAISIYLTIQKPLKALRLRYIDLPSILSSLDWGSVSLCPHVLVTRSNVDVRFYSLYNSGLSQYVFFALVSRSHSLFRLLVVARLISAKRVKLNLAI